MGNYIKGKVKQMTDGNETFEWNSPHTWKGNRVVHSAIDAIDANLSTSDFHISLPVMGKEYYIVDGKSFSAKESEYFIFNPQQEVKAVGEFKTTVEGICIFINEKTIQETAQAMSLPLEKSVDQPFEYPWQQQEFMVKSYRLKENDFGKYLYQLRRQLLQKNPQRLIDWDSFYFGLATEFLKAHRYIGNQLDSIQSVKTLTKQEIYRRLSLVHCYILECYDQPIALDDLQKVGMLSKYHLVRLYRQVYGKTPYQAILCERINRAKKLLKQNHSPTEIAFDLSFSDRRAFSKVFKKFVGVAPSKYMRNKIIN